MNEKRFLNFVNRPVRSGAGVEQLSCALCRGEVYPGEHYYLLEGRVVCETCLSRYARRYFAPQRRRLPRMGREAQ